MKIASLILMSLIFFVSLSQADEATDLGTIVIEASRSNDTVSNMNKNVSIISSQDIANSPAKSLPELLGTVPGVNAQVLSGIKYTQIDRGGFGITSMSNVLVLVDGRRLNVPDLSGPDLSLIVLNSIDHIEILQGAGTVLYGDNASGGVINIVLKKGRSNTKPSITMFSEIDSYKGNKDGLALTGGFGKWAYQFNYNRQQTNNYRTNNNYWDNNYDSHLNFAPTDIFDVDFAQGYHLDRYQLPGGLSLGDYNNYLGDLVRGIDSIGPTGAIPADLSINTTSDSHFDLTPHMKFDAGTGHIDLSLFTSTRKRTANEEYPYPLSPYGQNYETESYEFQPKLIVSTPLTDRLNNKLTTGYDYIYNHEKRRDNYNTPEDIVFATQASHNVYLLDELTVDEKWLVNAGARGAWAHYVFDQTQQVSSKYDRSETTEGYEGGLGYKYNPDSKVFVNYSHSYRLPVIDEFFQSAYPDFFGGGYVPAAFKSNLTHQVGNQYQLGIKDQSFKDIHLGFTATEAQYKNEIYYDPATYSNKNYDGRTRHYSQQADASIDLWNKRIKPFVNITFQQSTFEKGAYSGNQIPFVPDHLANAGITFKPWKALSTSLTTHFTGKEFMDGDQANAEPKLKRHYTVDWNIKYNFKNIELWFTLQNIFNSKYFAYGIEDPGVVATYYPAPGRNIAAGIKLKF